MHAYLIIGGSAVTRLAKAQEIAKKIGSKIIDFPAQKVADVRKLNEFLALSPQIDTAIFLEGVDQSTAEAQNALLKNLEEKDNFIFILTTETKARILPTIVSRCELITINQTRSEPDSLAENFIKMSTRQKLDYIAEIKTREDAQKFLDSLILTANKSLATNIESVRLTEDALDAKNMLTANTNVFLQLTNFVISLDRDTV